MNGALVFNDNRMRRQFAIPLKKKICKNMQQNIFESWIIAPSEANLWGKWPDASAMHFSYKMQISIHTFGRQIVCLLFLNSCCKIIQQNDMPIFVFLTRMTRFLAPLFRVVLLPADCRHHFAIAIDPNEMYITRNKNKSNFYTVQERCISCLAEIPCGHNNY